MSSVQELLLAAQSKAPRSAFSSLNDLLDTGISGYQTGQGIRDRNTEIAIKLLQKQQMEQQAAFQAERKKKFLADQEASTKTGFDAAGIKPQGVFPAQKITTSIDEKGNISDSYTTVEPKQAEPVDSLEKALAEKYRKGEITIEQFQKMKAEASPASVQFVGMQNGQPILLNPKTQQLSTGKLPGSGPLVSATQTEGQANAVLYGKRAEQADSQINDLAKKVDLSSVSTGIQSKLPNILQSSGVQQYEQSKRNFLNAILRRESGAVISPTEFAEGNKQYFDQAGDSVETKAQKALNRQTAIEGLRNASGLPQEQKPKKTKTSGSVDLGNGASYTVEP